MRTNCAGCSPTLILNAQQAIGDRGGSIVLKADDRIIEVKDDGPGMPKEVADRAFEPRFTTTRQRTTPVWLGPRHCQSHCGPARVGRRICYRVPNRGTDVPGVVDDGNTKRWWDVS